jgi:hypothetical protein
MKPTTEDINRQVRERLKTLPAREAHTVGRTAHSRAEFVAQAEKLATPQPTDPKGQQ